MGRIFEMKDTNMLTVPRQLGTEWCQEFKKLGEGTLNVLIIAR